MFLVMAIFERFLRPRSPLAENGRGGGGGDAYFGRRMGSSLDPEVHASKMEYSSSKFSLWTSKKHAAAPVALTAAERYNVARELWQAHA
ncbi:hypothetical protein ZIOFF_065311 [Zingiber officinale]|uniref:Uncharacterized protein n=1 Tax=Zingiber officinale TaxID=94328 RepID=A0A8J5EZ34_ZINOF|nr:hypothetical protein ZIOFF_065311 [Zingiber officinale]